MEHRVDRVEVGSIALLAAVGNFGWIVMVFDKDRWCCRSNRQDYADDDLKNKMLVITVFIEIIKIIIVMISLSL